jgi:hypothetical protein
MITKETNRDLRWAGDAGVELSEGVKSQTTDKPNG